MSVATSIRPASPATVDSFRQAMRRFPSGVTVVSGYVGGVAYGITVSSFCSVSMTPPLVLACLNNVGRASEALLRAENFAINILGATQEQVSNSCARAGDDERFNDVTSRRGLNGTPVVEGAAAVLMCSTFDRHPAGDHTILVGHVDGVVLGNDPAPLAYHDGGYVRLQAAGADNGVDR